MFQPFFFSSFLTDPVFPYWQGITLLFYVLWFFPKRPNGSPLLDLWLCTSVMTGDKWAATTEIGRRVGNHFSPGPQQAFFNIDIIQRQGYEKNSHDFPYPQT